MATYDWINVEGIASRSYTCGYCGNRIASERGWRAVRGVNVVGHVYVCHLCTRPTFFDEHNIQFPGVTFGDPVESIPDQITESLYEEARRAMGASSYTAVVLACRKILMHIAVSKGAAEGMNFAEYVKYLEDNHFFPPDAKEWVDRIRQKGNEANHEIVIMSRDDAEDILGFVEMLLKVIFEYPAEAKRRSARANL